MILHDRIVSGVNHIISGIIGAAAGVGTVIGAVVAGPVVAVVSAGVILGLGAAAISSVDVKFKFHTAVTGLFGAAALSLGFAVHELEIKNIQIPLTSELRQAMKAGLVTERGLVDIMAEAAKNTVRPLVTEWEDGAAYDFEQGTSVCDSVSQGIGPCQEKAALIRRTVKKSPAP